jgi:mannan endo-1,4-beta-mannosidase
MKNLLKLLAIFLLFGNAMMGKGRVNDLTDQIESKVNAIILDTLCMVDKSTTSETKALYTQLWKIPEKGFMFGHHDDLIYGRKWYNVAGGSDTKDVCGDFPGVFSVDFAEVMDDRYKNNTDNLIRLRVIKEARARGEVITACCHLNNPITNGDSWDITNNSVAKQIVINGSATNIRFKTWLDRLAAFAATLKDNQGNLIPIIFRPFHEHTQSWSWWGTACTTQDEFVNLWRFTVSYLRDTKGVHQFIYAISPQLDGLQTINDILFRWPGDDYVDFIGMDCYHGLYTDAFKENLLNLSILSQLKKKPCGVTETGVEGIINADGSDCTDYWTKQILAPLTGKRVSMVVMWRNKYDPTFTGAHYYSVFPGQASVTDFLTMYNSPLCLFSKDLPAMYVMAAGVSIVDNYVPNYGSNIIVCNFDNVISPMSGFSSNAISTVTNPSGSGKVGLVSVPSKNVGGITFTADNKINTIIHDKINFKLYATKAFTFTSGKLEDQTSSTINQYVAMSLAYTTPGKWQELTMDVSTINSNTYDRIVLFPEAWSNKSAFSFYIDDITLVKNSLISGTEANKITNPEIRYLGAQHRLNIKCIGEGWVEIISISGRIVKNYRIYGDDNIELLGIQNGVYVVRLKSSGAWAVQKIIVRNTL